MKRRILSCIMILSIAFSLIGVLPVAAADVTYEVTGGMIYFDAATGTVTDCDTTVTAAVIPEEIYGVKVTAIGNSAFRDCRQLTSVTVPAGVTAIEDRAFQDTKSLSEITLSRGLQSIGEWSFYGSGLPAIQLPDTLQSIGWLGFAECRNLKRLVIPDSVTALGKNLCTDCYSLESVVIGENVPLIPDASFTKCRELKTITLGSSIKSIGAGAFRYCTNLQQMILPEGVETIYNTAFQNCESLKYIYIPDSVSSIGHNAFDYCTGLTQLVFPKSLTIIEERLLRGCTALKKVGIPIGINLVKLSAFSGCSALSDVYYGGDLSAWTAIEVKEYNNPLSAAKLHLNSELEQTPPVEIPFVDVPENAFYSEPVSWALEFNITKGLDETHFAPDATCTRGQVVTFLWRAAGSPKPRGTNNPFKDVKKGAFYYNAVLWAVENKITSGTTKTTFSPDDGCTRGQVVTFLWRAKGSPNPAGTNNPFNDVKKGAFYYNAVLWAVQNKITSGMTKTTFAPNATCTRGQIVTFLYRDKT